MIPSLGGTVRNSYAAGLDFAFGRAIDFAGLDFAGLGVFGSGGGGAEEREIRLRRIKISLALKEAQGYEFCLMPMNLFAIGAATEFSVENVCIVYTKASKRTLSFYLYFMFFFRTM